jgi:hypothetical protein
VFFDADSFVTADLAAAALRPSLFGQTAEDGAAGTAAAGGALGAGTGGATAAFAPSRSSSSSSSSGSSGGGGGASVSPEVARALRGAFGAGARFEAPAVLARYAAAFLVPPACPQAQAHAARLASRHRAGLRSPHPLALAFHAEARGPGGGPLVPDVVLPVALVPDVGGRDGVGAGVGEASVGRRGSAVEGRNAGAAAAAALASALGGQPPAEGAAVDGGVEGDGDSESEEEEEEEGCRLYDDIDLGGLALLDRLSLRAVFPDQASDFFRLYFLRRLLGFSCFGVFFHWRSVRCSLKVRA